MRRQPKLVDYDGLRTTLENSTEHPELFKRLIETTIRPCKIHDSLQYGRGVNWASLSNKDRLDLASGAEWRCHAYFPDIKNCVYAPDQVVEICNPIGVWEDYSKEKIQDNLLIILGLASRIPEEFYQEDGCSYERITVDRDSGRWADGDTYISAAFTGLCVAAGLLEYINDPPSSYQEYQARQNPTLVRATPGFRQYMKPYHEALKSTNSEGSLQHARAIGEYILTTKVG